MSVVDIPELYHCLSVGSQNTNCHIHPYLQGPTSLSMLFRSRLIERAQPEGINHPTWEDLCNTHASSSPLSGTNSRHPQLNSSIRLTLTVLPLSCKVTTLHIKPYVASNWSNYFHSKVFSKLLMTATIGSQPSCEKKRSSTYYGTFVSLGP